MHETELKHMYNSIYLFHMRLYLTMHNAGWISRKDACQKRYTHNSPKAAYTVLVLHVGSIGQVVPVDLTC